MPTRYQPETDYKPLGWGLAEECDTDTEIEDLSAALHRAADRLVFPLEQCGCKLEEDDREAFLGDLERLIIRFVVKCRAHPLRTPAMLLPTARQIRRNPGGFFGEIEKYSPDVVVLVYREFGRIYPKDMLLEWEAGKEKAAPVSQAKVAAKAAIDTLKQKAESGKLGRPRQKRVKRLAVKLGKLFLNAGGKLGRTYDYNSGQERGPFREFLEQIIGLVEPLIMATGHHLNPDTMVRRAQKKLLGEGRGRRKVTT